MTKTTNPSVKTIRYLTSRRQFRSVDIFVAVSGVLVVLPALFITFPVVAGTVLLTWIVGGAFLYMARQRQIVLSAEAMTKHHKSDYTNTRDWRRDCDAWVKRNPNGYTVLQFAGSFFRGEARITQQAK